METFEMIQTTKVDQQRVRTLLKKMEDDGMEDMVGQEGLEQIINLLVEDHIDNIMFGKLSNSNYLGDWMQCVTEEDIRNGIFVNEQQVNCPRIFQLDIDKVEKLIEFQSTISHHNNSDGHWEEIKAKISVDPILD